MHPTRIAVAALATGAALAATLSGAASAAPSRTTLINVAAAPPKAETSIALIPKGWRFAGFQGPDTVYAPPGHKGGIGNFAGEIVVDVHLRLLPDGRHPLTVAGYPASYRDEGGTQIVDLIYSKRVDIDVQIWRNARTTREQALRIAGTVDVRSVKIKSRG